MNIHNILIPSEEIKKMVNNYAPLSGSPHMQRFVFIIKRLQLVKQG